MYITDLRHFLDDSGAISVPEGYAGAMAQFQADLVANASDATEHPLAAPRCFKCKSGTVKADLAPDAAILWTCPKCGAEDRISHWRGSLWDLRHRPIPRG
jgi:ribosomal protein L37AE/L43A